MTRELSTVAASAALVVATTAGPVRVTSQARSIRPGELVVLTVSASAPVSQWRVRGFGRDWPSFSVDGQTARALVGIDLDVTPGTYAVSIDADRTQTSYPLVVKARVFPTRRLKVDEAFVNPPASAAERIAREAKELETFWKTATPSRRWEGPFVRPVPDDANSAFGTRSIFNGQPRSPHGGADFLSRAGTPVESPNAGRVVLAHELYYTGNTVVIDHGLGLYSLFAHLSEIDVRESDDVHTHERLGLVGATGRVTGPHLHWAVRLNTARIDPLSLIEVLGK